MKRQQLRLGVALTIGVLGIGLLDYRPPSSHSASDESSEPLKNAQAEATVQPNDDAAASTDPLDFSPLYAGKLNVWFTTSLNNKDKQSLLDAFPHDFPQFELNDRTVSEASFVDDWNAASGESMPDVAFISTAATFHVLLQKNAIWSAEGIPRFPTGLNWWFISKKSPHIEAARAFVRWITTSPHWQPQPVRNTSLSIWETKAIETKALAAAKALGSRDHVTLEKLLDPEALRPFDSNEGFEITSAKPLQTFGNSQIAFTIIEAAFSSDHVYGTHPMAFIFRKRGINWLILHMDGDDLHIDGVDLPYIEMLFRSLDRLITEEGTQTPPPKPELTVVDTGGFAWQEDVGSPLSFVMEVQGWDPTRPLDGGKSFLDIQSIRSGSLGRQSFHIDAHLYRGRIWAMSSSGMTTLSDWRGPAPKVIKPDGPLTAQIAVSKSLNSDATHSSPLTLKTVSQGESLVPSGVTDSADGKINSGVGSTSQDKTTSLRMAADQGNAQAALSLGALYEGGRGVEQNYAQALDWFKKAGDRGLVMAQHKVGRQYLQGLGVDRDYAQAMAWFRRAADQGYAPAQVSVGLLYQNGQGVEKDPVQATVWFDKASNQGPQSQLLVGRQFQYGQLLDKDYSQATLWIQKAADQGFAPAQMALGQLFEYTDRDYAKAKLWYQKAADQGDAQAALSLGALYEGGRGVEQNYAQALDWFKKAGDRGLVMAQHKVGRQYLQGLGVDRDYAQAMAWFRRAADQGYAPAQVSVGLLYQNGQGVEKDPVQATVWFDKASNQGPQSQLLVGRQFQYGQLLDKDYSQATLWI